MNAQHRTANFHNYGPVQNQVGVQNIHGQYRHTVNVSVETANPIPYAQDAAFDSFGASATSCHPQTRIDLLEEIKRWTKDVAEQNIFWLQGKAGTGKSTISHTIAEYLDAEDRLGASFFFKRGEGDRGTARLLFPTLARQLVGTIPGFGPIVDQIVKDNSRIFEKKLSEQFDKLIYEPLQTLASNGSTFALPTIIIIDALDECDNDDHIGIILKLWSFGLQRLNKCIKVFVTSRPELPIRIGFGRMSTGTFENIDLHDVPESITRHDLFVFLKDNLLDFVSEYNTEPIDDLLDEQWPGEDRVRRLVEISHPLFIIAATICRSLRNLNTDPVRQLREIMESRVSGNFKQVGRVYFPVLERALGMTSESEQTNNTYSDFQEIVGTIAVLAEPLSISALANLLQKPEAVVRLQLRPLHSVLHIPNDPNLRVRPVHLSFAEFLLAREAQSYPFGVNRTNAHRLLLTKSLRLLSNLRENLCRLSSPGERRESVDDTTIERYIPLELRYSCRYWIDHLKNSKTVLRDGDEVCAFLQSHLLHWLEALSLLGLMSECVDLIADLQSLAVDSEAEQLKNMLEDIRSFVHFNRHIIRVAPLQIYASARIFLPQSSVVRNMAEEPSWVESFVNTGQTWSATREVMEGHSDGINAITFAENQVIASGSDDKTVRLWDSATGLEIQKLDGHTDSVVAVAISSKNDLLASASNDGVVHLWDLSIGRIERTEELTDLVPELDGSMITALSFQEGGRLLALVVYGSLFMWDVFSRTLKLMYSPDGYVTRATFSGDWKAVLCVSVKSTRSEKGESEADESRVYTLSTIELPSYTVTKVSGSGTCNFEYRSYLGLSGTILAFWDFDRFLHLHHLHTDTCLCRFDVGKYDYPNTIALSHDLRLAAIDTLGNALKVLALREHEEQTESPGNCSSLGQGAQFLTSTQNLVANQRETLAVYSWKGELQQTSLVDESLATVPQYLVARALSHQGNLFAYAHNGKLGVYDLRNESHHFVLIDEASDNVEEILFSNDDQMIVTRGASGLLVSRLVASPSEVTTTTLQRLQEYCFSEAVEFEGKSPINAGRVAVCTATAHKSPLLAVVFGVNSLALWDIASGKLAPVSNGEPELLRQGDRVEAMVFSPDDSLIASIARREISIWRMCSITQMWQPLARFQYPGPVMRYPSDYLLAISRDNRILAAADEDNLAICKLQQVEGDWELRTLHVLSFGPAMVGPQIHHLRFGAVDDMLCTNLGNILISDDESVSFPGLFVQGKWIQKDGQDLLWIPYVYRTRYMFVVGNRILMLSEEGDMNTIRITYPATSQQSGQE